MVNGWTLFWALVLGVLAYVVAHVVFNDFWSFVIGAVVAIAVAFPYRRNRV
jgi:predicted ABC-type sugar transport system permease subunit